MFLHPYICTPVAFSSCQVKLIRVFAVLVRCHKQKHVLFTSLANHSGGAQRKSPTLAAFVLSFLFHVCLSEMAKPFRGLTVLHLGCVFYFVSPH